MAEEIEELDTFYCSCGQDFEHRQILEVHKKICQTIKELKEKDKENQCQRRVYNCYNCAFCHKEFNCTGNLKVHISQHHKDKEMKCEICDKIFSDYHFFSKHKRTAHKKFKCDKCNKQFICQDYLVFHYNIGGCTEGKKKVPKSPPRYACKECEKIFKSKHTLQNHIINVHQIRYKCAKCSQEFKSQPALINHHKQNHADIKIIKPVKPKFYKCTQCAYSTDIIALFQRHFLRNKH